MSFRVDHVQLPASIGGLRQARHFYNELIGLPEVRDDDTAHPETLRFSLGHQWLHVTEGHYLGVAPNAHLALQTDDLSAIQQRLRDARVPIERQRLDRGEAILVEDPFGNRLELIGRSH